jgi:hypothetical protein
MPPVCCATRATRPKLKLKRSALCIYEWRKTSPLVRHSLPLVNNSDQAAKEATQSKVRFQTA